MAALRRYLNWRWRQLATGLAFAVFGLGGLLLPLYALPWLLLTPGGERREARARWLVQQNFRLFMRFMRLVGIMNFSVQNLAELQRPGQLILANHPSLIDVVFLISLLPRADCVVKSELLRNPTMRGVISLAGYIANSDPEQVLKAARATLARGNSLIIFPEGTRTEPGQPIRMQRGAANVALRLSQAIRPVVIDVSPATLTKGLPWYRVPESGPFSMLLRVMPEIIPEPVPDPAAASLAARRLTRQLEHYFTEELTAHGATGTGA